jgi:hypothetical protein
MFAVLPRTRAASAARAACLHLGVSLVVAILVAGLVFGVWYRPPFHELTGGTRLFLLVMVIDVVCGPVLTLVLFNPAKSKAKWRLDLGLIVLTQLAALVYGLSQVASARPVLVALEGDRFRLVQAFDVDTTRLREAPESLQTLSLSGPKLIGVRLSNPSDADFPESVKLASQGFHPAFRPSRWVEFSAQVPGLLQKLKPMGELRMKNAEKAHLIDEALRKAGVPEEQVGYLPLVLDVKTDWVALVRRTDGVPVQYLHLDGW